MLFMSIYLKTLMLGYEHVVSQILKGHMTFYAQQFPGNSCALICNLCFIDVDYTSEFLGVDDCTLISFF